MTDRPATIELVGAALEKVTGGLASFKPIREAFSKLFPSPAEMGTTLSQDLERVARPKSGQLFPWQRKPDVVGSTSFGFSDWEQGLRARGLVR
jgi:hypothetical protein